MDRENNATNVGNKIIPTNVPIVEAPIMILYWDSTNSNVFEFGAVSTKLPVKGCCIIFAILDTITIKLKRDKADAISPTLAPERRTAYASVSIVCITKMNRDM